MKMMRRHGPWIVKGTEQKYQNDFVEVCEDDIIRPNGEPGAYTTVSMNPRIAVLAIDNDSNVYLTSQFQYALGEESLEVVSGVIEKEESPIEAARRELREELGIMANRLIELGEIRIDTSIIKAPINFFLPRI